VRCAAVRRLRKLLGRRGTPLFLLGIGQICWGAGYVAQPLTGPGLSMLTRIAPLHCWAWLWILSGTVAFTCSWLRIGRDWIGFYAACIPPLIWAFAYGTATVTGEYERGAFVFGWYLTSHVGMTLWAATIPEPPRRRRSTENRGGS
jgi:hypothetical protein